MSLSFQPLTPVCVRDPLTMINHERTYAVLKSGSQCTYKYFTTTSISNTSIQFSCPPPSGGVIVNRKITLSLPIRLTFTGVASAVGLTLLNTNCDAPRAFPINSSIDTLSITINNQSESINIGDIVHALMHYNTDNDLKNMDYSTTPTYQDQAPNYSDTFASNIHPLGLYGVNNDGSQMPRGGFPFIIVQNPVSVDNVTPITAIVDIIVTEPLFLPPLLFGKNQESGFFFVNTMDFNFTFMGQMANRLWSHMDLPPPVVPFPVTISYQILGAGQVVNPAFSYDSTSYVIQPHLNFQYVTPQETMVIPNNMPITYPYFNIVRFITGGFLPAAANTTRTYTSNNLQLSSIPRRMYVFVRQQNADLYASPNNTDTFFAISNVNIQFLNKNGLLASQSPEQLYAMCVKNHCKISYPQSGLGGPSYCNQIPNGNGTATAGIGQVGLPVCIEFATDIGLDSLQAPGILNQCMLQISVTARNTNMTKSITPNLFIVAVFEGTFTVNGIGSASSNVGVLTAKDVLDCQQRDHVNYQMVQDVSGGDFWSGLKEFGAKLWPYIQKAHDYVKEHKLLSSNLSKIPHPYAQYAAKAADYLGYGDDQGGVVLGAGRVNRKTMRNRAQY